MKKLHDHEFGLPNPVRGNPMQSFDFSSPIPMKRKMSRQTPLKNKAKPDDFSEEIQERQNMLRFE